jgi:hypothetical protein
MDLLRSTPKEFEENIIYPATNKVLYAVWLVLKHIFKVTYGKAEEYHLLEYYNM